MERRERDNQCMYIKDNGILQLINSCPPKIVDIFLHLDLYDGVHLHFQPLQHLLFPEMTEVYHMTVFNYW